MALNSHFDRVTESKPPCPRILNHIPECEESTSPPPAKKPRQLELGNYFNKVISELPIYLKTPPGVESEYSMKRVVGADSTTAHRLVLVGAILKTLSAEERQSAMSLCKKINENGLAVALLKYITKHPGRRVKVTDAMKKRWSPEYIEEIRDCYEKGQICVDAHSSAPQTLQQMQSHISVLCEDEIIIEEEEVSPIHSSVPTEAPRKLNEYFKTVIQNIPVFLKDSDPNGEYSMKRVIGADSTTAHRLILVGAIVKSLSEEDRYWAMTLSNKTDENGLAVELLKYMSKNPGRRMSIINSMKERWCDEFIDEIQDCYRVGQACVDCTTESSEVVYFDVNGVLTK